MGQDRDAGTARRTDLVVDGKPCARPLRQRRGRHPVAVRGPGAWFGIDRSFVLPDRRTRGAASSDRC